MNYKVLIIHFIVTLFISGCVQQTNSVQIDPKIKHIYIKVNNNTLLFKEKLTAQIGNNKVLRNSPNELIATVVNNSVKDSKYKKKIYINNGKYQYKNCYVNTHNFVLMIHYKGHQETIKTVTVNDSCDKYMFDNYQTYTIDKAINQVINTINKHI